ncbi:hypothetical protein [Protaetiibacter intestinalis]|uniref:Uncharacterized protein n=1 Tax=Protaetiibacter intestinalis TaxID=2419774 RepID=A0A387B5P2_9MICO|nr:hypothetical protein [Protaetiibacter intestinalis]AYF97041.1 hypothetical protein D7I47_01430 [Protaetiibacter intestinalis]
MTRSFTLADPASLDDLQVYLSRAQRVEDGSVRLIGGSGVLAVYSAVLYPVGLLDLTPTVLGLRTFALASRDDFDAVVPIRSLLLRVERAQQLAVESIAAGREEAVAVGLPMEVHTATWAAISPPRGGWRGVPPIEGALLDRVAREGIAEVAEAVPDAVGESIVRRVRGEVWGREIAGFEHIPTGAAFALDSLGFAGDEQVRVYETGPWTRLTTHRGHVLIRRRAWTLSR